MCADDPRKETNMKILVALRDYAVLFLLIAIAALIMGQLGGPSP
jgi:hypothetical protein